MSNACNIKSTSEADLEEKITSISIAPNITDMKENLKSIEKDCLEDESKTLARKLLEENETLRTEVDFFFMIMDTEIDNR